ncbi:MAG: 4Fe-4S cluster-binding domain-containing protein [Bacteroidales bacterium]
MVDGDGLRTVIFLSGCSVGCKECQNKKHWNIKSGKSFSIDELVKNIKEKTPQKKVTISGGEPLEQKEPLKILMDKLDGFDIGLYTSYELESIDKEIIDSLSFVKTGKFEHNKKVYGKYFGSSNQKMIYLKGNN